MTLRALASLGGRGWTILWGAVWLVLVWALPTQPVHRIPLPGAIAVRGFADPRTLVAESVVMPADGISLMPAGPIVVLDLPTGALRTIALPDDAFDRRTPLASRQVWNGAPWRLDRLEVAGDAVVVQMVPIKATGYVYRAAPRRLLVWDVRTGEERYRHEFAGGSAIGLLGETVWVQGGGGSDPPFAKRMELRTFQELPTAIPPAALGWLRAQRSADGQFLVGTQESAVQVWQIHAAEPVWTTRADIVAISSDSRRLATLTYGVDDADPDGPERELWRVHDLANGAILAEKHHPVAGHRPPVERLAFLGDDRCVVAYTSSPPFPKALRSMPVVGGVDVWEWQAGTLRSLRSAVGELYRTDPQPATPQAAPPVVLDEEALIDVATGERVGTVPMGGTLCNVDPTIRWGVVRNPSWTVADLLLRLTRKVSPWLANVFVGPGDSVLYDLREGRVAARLLPGLEGGTFSPDGKWLVKHGPDMVEIWSLPPRRPWGRALLISLAVPALALCARWRRVRPGGDRLSPG